jgi:archaeal flagellin FlaB
MFNKYLKHEKGITGLETAIILIAFVVVAAVFAYTALSAGLFATQKSQEAVYSGLTEAQSTLELRGGVIATANATGANGGVVKQISFIVANVLGGEPIDFTEPTANTTTHSGLADPSVSHNKVVIKYLDANQTVSDLYWQASPLGTDNGNALLEANEKFMVTIGDPTAGAGGGNLIDALTTDLGTNQKFTLEILTPAGAILQIERTTPAYISLKMNLR